MEIQFRADLVESSRITRGTAYTLALLFSATVFWQLGYSVIPRVLLFTAAIVAASAWLLITKSRRAPSSLLIELQTIRIPISFSLTHRQFNLSKLHNWQILKLPTQEAIVAANKHSIISISNKQFTPQNWEQLRQYFEKSAGPPREIKNYPIHLFWWFFVASILGMHWFSVTTVDLEAAHQAFVLIGNGGANWQLVKSGDLWRLASANLVHAHLPHLCINVGALVFIAAQCGNRFRTIDFAGLVSAVGLISVATTIQIPIVTVALGASGIIYGLYGFLYAAQRSGDERLHPWHRAHFTGGLLGILTVELIAGVVITNYGAIIHLIGLATGYLYYQLFIRATDVDFTFLRRAGQLVLVLFAVYASAGFIEARLNWLKKDQTPLALRLINQDNFRLTTIGGLVLADQADVTDTEIEHLLQRIDDHRSKGEFMNRVKARALHWQGETTRPLGMLRKWIERYPKDEGAQNFLAALEREAAERRPAGLGKPSQRLQAGSGTAVLLNHTLDRIAFVPLKEHIQDIREVLPKHQFDSWYLLTVYPQSRENPRSWYLERADYPTRASRSLTK